MIAPDVELRIMFALGLLTGVLLTLGIMWTIEKAKERGEK